MALHDFYAAGELSAALLATQERALAAHLVLGLINAAG
jgi:hypothetical protein